MSTQVTVTELKDWLKRTLSSNIAQAERERDKLVSEISKAIDNLANFCSQLASKAESDMEAKRENRAQYRAAKAVGRVTSIIPGMSKTVTIPASKDAMSLRNLQRQASKFASDASQSRNEWLRQIRPYYIIDMMTLGGNIDKVRRLGEELHAYLMGRGALLRSLEELDEKLASLSKAQGIRNVAEDQRKLVETKIAEARKEEQVLRSQAEEVRRNPKVKEYLQVGSGLRELRDQLIRSGFSRLGGPLRKFVSVSERGDYPTPIEVRDSAREYVRKPFTTFLAETEQYPKLKAVMSELSKAVSSSKLALKPREAKKVIERTDQIVLANSLAELHSKARELKREHDELLSDQQTAALVQQLRDLRAKGRKGRQLQDELKGELGKNIENETKLDEQIDGLVKDIEGFAKKLAGVPLKLQRS